MAAFTKSRAAALPYCQGCLITIVRMQDAISLPPVLYESDLMGLTLHRSITTFFQFSFQN